MALTGDAYANDTSSDEGAAEMENNYLSAAADEAAEDADDNDANNHDLSAAADGLPADAAEDIDTNKHDENIELTASRLQEHNEQMESESNPQQNIDENEAANSSAGAGLLFGLSGLILGGPILGTIAGVSAAVVASNDHGPAGDNARAAGTFAITTGSKIGDAARDVNEKHGVLDWIQNVFIMGWGKVRQFDQEHHTSEAVKETMSTVSDKVVGFEREHHLFENMLVGIQSGVQFLLEKVKGATESNDKREQRG